MFHINIINDNKKATARTKDVDTTNYVQVAEIYGTFRPKENAIELYTVRMKKYPEWRRMAFCVFMHELVHAFFWHFSSRGNISKFTLNYVREETVAYKIQLVLMKALRIKNYQSAISKEGRLAVCNLSMKINE